MEKIFGKHSVRAVFLARPGAIRRVILAGDKSAIEEFGELARRAGVVPEIQPWREFLRIGKFSESDKHQGVCIFAEPRKILDEKDFDTLADARLILALDQISSPQNLGTMLRSAAFFGVDGMVLPKDRSVDVSPAVARVAVGGAEFVKIFKVTNLARSLETLKKLGFWVYGLDERGEKTLAEVDFAEKTVLVVGAEDEGLRLKTTRYCDELVRIPGGRPGLESLNAGVATAVALAEFFR